MPIPRAADTVSRFRPKRIVEGLVALIVAAGFLAWAYVLLNPSVLPPRGRIPAASAPMSTVAQTYIEAAKQQDCGLTRALTASSTWSWCNDPRLLSYRLEGRTGVEGECMAYEVTLTASSDGTILDGTQPWTLCFRQTKAGWRLWDQGPV